MHTEICSSLILSFWTFTFLKVQRFLQRICRLLSMLFWLGFHGRTGLWSERQDPRQTNSRVLSQGTKNETRQLISGSFLPDAVILIIWANLLNPVIIFDRVLTDLGSGGFEKNKSLRLMFICKTQRSGIIGLEMVLVQAIQFQTLTFIVLMQYRFSDITSNAYSNKLSDPGSQWL